LRIFRIINCLNQDFQDLRIFRIILSEIWENTIQASSKCYPNPAQIYG
jgi:hypothetical protein